MTEKLEQENRSKYGQRADDLIARTYRDNHDAGNDWCYLNVTKYLGRYCRKGSAKAGIYENLIKAKDYLDRMIEANIPPIDAEKKTIPSTSVSEKILTKTKSIERKFRR